MIGIVSFCFLSLAFSWWLHVVWHSRWLSSTMRLHGHGNALRTIEAIAATDITGSRMWEWFNCCGQLRNGLSTGWFIAILCVYWEINKQLQMFAPRTVVYGLFALLFWDFFLWNRTLKASVVFATSFALIYFLLIDITFSLEIKIIKKKRFFNTTW